MAALLITIGSALAADGDLDLNASETTITINGLAITNFSEDPAIEQPVVNVSPGDVVTVDIEYTNELDNILIGNVVIEAVSDINPDFINYTAEKWALLPATPTSHQFQFTVPYTVITGFDLTITISDEDEEGIEYEDTQTITLTLVRNAQDIHINEVTAADDNLTCTRATDIRIEATNNGENDVQPEAWIFDAQATMDADGNFDRAPEFGSYDFGNAIAPGNERQETIDNVNFSSLSAGTHNIYVYTVSPFFWRGADAGFEVHENIVPLTVGSCLNTSEIEEEFTFNKNSNNNKVIDLLDTDNNEDEDLHYPYINEDRDYGDSLLFSVTGQTNKDLVSCSVNEDDDSTLTCTAPSQDSVGESIVNVTMTYLDGDVILTEITEPFTVSVTEALELRNIRINGLTEAQLEEQDLEVRPLQDIVVTFTVRNELAEPVTGIQVTLEDTDANDGFQFIFDEDVNLHLNAHQESATQTITVTLPVNIPEGDYDLSLVAEGETLDDQVQTDSFDFQMEIEPLASEIILAAEVAEEEQELTCEAETTINAEYSNTGSVDENDLVLQVKERNEVIYDSREANNGQFLLLAQGQTQQQQISIPVRGQGNHAYTIELLYNFDAAGEVPASRAAPQTVHVTKNGCIVSFSPEEELLLSDEGVPLDFSVELGEGGDADLLTWFVNDEIIQQGGNLYTLQQQEAAPYNVNVVYNEDEDESNTWDVIISNIPLSFSGSLQTNVPDDATDDDLFAFEDFTIQNQFGQIHFLEPVDIRSLVDLDDVVRIGSGFVSVDSEFASHLDVPARITLNNFPQGRTFIYQYEAFGNPAQLQGRQRCEAPQCQVVSHNNTVLVFDVQGFSTYQAVNEREVSMEVIPAELNFNDVTRGQNTNTTFVLRNAGTLNPMTGITVDVSAIAAKYNVQVQNVPSELQAGQEQTVTVLVTIPQDENAGKHTIGSLKIDSAETAETVVPLFVTPKSFLKIESIKINGKPGGELEPDNKENKIEVKV
ncbi:MAG: hypothetical protein AABX37_06125, partial [Nanoarchaeota archaeon]